MADRFPLILNTSTNQIQEIPSGDNLDLTGVGINNVGVITSGNVIIGAATTDLVVTGDARITGILTVGTSSLKLDGPNNLVNVGTALTLGHTQGLQFHTQNLHSAGFEVNQINASGIITATEADINGDLDVDGHTNLDNVSVSGVSTFASNVIVNGGISNAQYLNLSATAPSIDFNDTNHNSDFMLQNANGLFKLYDNTNTADRVTVASNGNVSVKKDLDVDGHTNLDNVSIAGVATITGNLNVGGVLTYEDVTNVDSIGIITARNGINVSSGTATFQGAIDANGDLDVDGHTNLDNVSVAGVSTYSGAATFNGTVNSNAALNIGANSHINLATGNWAGNSYGKIQHHANRLYLGAGSNADPCFVIRYDGTDRIFMTSGGTLYPVQDSNADLGKPGLRWANIYGDTLYGAGSNITSLNATNLSSGTVPLARLGDSGTKSSTTFLAGDNTFKAINVAINSIASDGANRVLTSDGDATATAEASLTFDGNTLYCKGASDNRLNLNVPSGNGDDWNYINFVGEDGTRDGFIGTWSDGTMTIQQDGGSRLKLYGSYAGLVGNFVPESNNTYDLGTTANRWRNIYTNDLNLSNEGGSNDVDGTWGKFTIQEGESDLFLINNRNGKKYKFNLTEVS